MTPLSRTSTATSHSRLASISTATTRLIGVRQERCTRTVPADSAVSSYAAATAVSALACIATGGRIAHERRVLQIECAGAVDGATLGGPAVTSGPTVAPIAAVPTIASAPSLATVSEGPRII